MNIGKAVKRWQAAHPSRCIVREAIILDIVSAFSICHCPYTNSTTIGKMT